MHLLDWGPFTLNAAVNTENDNQSVLIHRELVVSLVWALSSFARTAESVHSSSLVRLKVLVVSKSMDSAVFARSWTAEKDKAYLGAHCFLTLKAPITTAADGIYKYFFIVFFRENKT